MSVVVYIGLGSNLGNRVANLRRAVDALSSHGAFEGVRCSSLFESPPQGKIDQPDFVNAVVKAQTTVSPSEVLSALLAIERELGRERSSETVRFGPRVIDLDLLFYGDAVLRSPDLEIPHPRLHERPFVLAPLMELDSELIHPLEGETVAALLARAGGARTLRRLEE